MPRQHVTGQGRPSARWVASPQRSGVRRPPQSLYCYNRHPNGIREPALYLWTPLVCTGMPLCTAIDSSCPFTPSAPELEPGHNHINPTALATPHSPSSTQSTHHGPRKTSSGSVRASHSKLPRLRDTRTLPRPRNGHCSQSAQQSNRYYPALKNNAPRDDPTPYCHGFLPGLPITPLLHLLQASQPAPTPEAIATAATQ